MPPTEPPEDRPATGDGGPRTVSVVPHTHWDREWYAPFQRFRLRLVDLVDQLLERLDRDPGWAHFMLDGQMAAVDDHLEVRPEAAAALARHNASGRLAMGPWYVLPDEFLVSGETLVRDLRMGIARAARFGGAMPVGYLPDMFGHVAQMPQILHQFGLERAVVWRGVPSAVDRSSFTWVAPDGTSVRAEYLPQGYGNGARLPDDAKDLVALVDDFVATHGDLLVGSVLWMNGADHVRPRAWLPRVVAEANALQDDYRLVVRPLADHLADQDALDPHELPRWEGELRSGARANLLMGVASNRVDVKIAAARAERALEALAEPLAALFLPPERWPARKLELAWTDVVRNAAHDSICACSHDDVVTAVRHRYAEATHLAEGLVARSLAHIGRTAGVEGAVVVNPSARARGGVVELTIPGSGPADGLQVLDETPAHARLHEVRADEAVTVVEREIDIHGELLGIDLDEAPSGEHDGVGAVVVLRCGERMVEAPPREARAVLDAIAGLAATDPGARVVVEIERPPSRTGLVHVDEVPGFSWRAWEGRPSGVEPAVVGPSGLSLANGCCEVVVDPASGTWSCDGVAGLGRLVDDGDLGDTYNWCPPAEDAVVDRPERVEVTVEEEGPVRGRLAIASTYRWPARVEGDTRVGERLVRVRTTLELRAGEGFVRVTTSLDNQARDHRLRAWFPLPEPAAGSEAECAFTVVRRGLDAEGGPTERGLPTFPSRRFVRAGGLTVAHEGLCEYEVVDVAGEGGAARGRALALTLLRCTGMLSQGPMATRPLPAGPEDPLEGPQLQGPVTVRYAVAVGDVDPCALVEDAFVPLLVAEGRGGGGGPTSHTALTLDGGEVTAVERVGTALHVRVANPTDEPVTVEVPGRTGWVVDLAHRPLDPFEGAVELPPHRIATLALD